VSVGRHKLAFMSETHQAPFDREVGRRALEVLIETEKDRDEKFASLSRGYAAAADSRFAKDPSVARVLRLFSSLLSMFPTEDVSKPYGPMMSFDGRRTMTLEDVEESTVAFLDAIHDLVPAGRLGHRLGDVLWLRGRGETRRHGASLLFESCLASRASVDDWFDGGRTVMERGLDVSMRLGGSSKAMTEQLVAVLMGVVAADDGESYAGLQAAEMLHKYQQGRSDGSRVRDLLRNRAENVDYSISFRRDYARAASAWSQQIEPRGAWLDDVVLEAELWVLEAESRQGESSSNAVAAAFFENAVQCLRRVPRRERQLRNVDERVEVLLARSREAGMASLDEMAKISSDAFDASAFVAEAKARVIGLAAADALAQFVSLVPLPDEEAELKSADALLDKFTLMSMFGTTHFSQDGRVVARSSSQRRDANGAPTGALWNEVVRSFRFKSQLSLNFSILPALWVLWEEHNLTETDFLNVCRGASIVPRDRERMIARGLWLGWCQDFGGSLSILVPQLENIIRQVLKAGNIRTSTTDGSGIETENGLGSLLESSELRSIFGAGHVLEMKMLFTDPIGPNLRNEVAHGLLSDESMEGLDPIYAWWFMLRLVFTPYWNSLGATRGTTAGGD
jgi:hypothetical protein